MTHCAHDDKIIVGARGERDLYWCSACGALGSWGKRFDDLRWRLPMPAREPTAPYLMPQRPPAKGKP